MRARQRHLNPAHAGAGIVLDSRFINQADGSSVITWTDRSPNGRNATQSTAASQPTFETNELNGNPVVSFDGSNDILSLTSVASDYLNNVGYGAIVAVVKDRSPTTGDNDHQVMYFSRNGSASQFRFGLGTRGGGLNVFRAGARRLDADAFTGASVTSNSNYNILTAVGNFSDGTIALQVNNKQEASANLPSSGNTSATNSDAVAIGGVSGADFGDNPMNAALLLAFNASLSAALLNRIHRSAAFSFKIACS
jgi:hypothetical protein